MVAMPSAGYGPPGWVLGRAAAEGWAGKMAVID
jgi:hypothetical protein